MTAEEACEQIRRLEEIATEAGRWKLRDASWHAESLERITAICASLEHAPGPPGLVREKLASILGEARELFSNQSDRAWQLSSFILADCHSLRSIVTRAAK